MAQIAKRVLKNTLFLYGKIGITSICLIFSTRFTLQALGVEDFGIYNLICSTVIMLSFLNDSMTAATQRFMSYAEGEGDFVRIIKIFNSSYAVHIVIAFIIIATFVCLEPLVFGNYLQIASDRIHAAKVIYFFTIFTTSMSIITVPYNAVLIAHENMLYYSILGSLDGILKLGAAILTLYVPSDKLISYSAFLMIIGMSDFIICRLYCHSKYSECKISFRKHTDIKIIKEMFSFAGWQLTYSGSSILSIQGMGLILNSYFGSVMNASQGIARQVCGQMMTLSGNMMNALNPVIVKTAGAKQQESMIKIVMVGSKVSYLLVVVIAIPILLEIPYILDIWLTEVPDYAIPFSRYEILQQIIASFTVTLVTMIMGVGDVRNFQLFSALTYIIRLPIVYIVLYFFGNPIHAYWIATACVILLCIVRVYYAHSKCGLPTMIFLKSVIIPCVFITAIDVVAVLSVIDFLKPSLLRLIITFSLSTIILLISAYYIAMNKSEKLIIRNIGIQLKNKLARHKS